MEWFYTIPVNEILHTEITKLNSTLIPPGFRGDVSTQRLVQETLGKLIDHFGEQSAAAQNLKKAITTAEKMRNAPTHILYILKDAKGNAGRGEVIGYLKVGRKQLFLFDNHNKTCKVEPLCVLDFYVSQGHQRHGYGRRLFDHMIQDFDIHPKYLAIDGPSDKMVAFMRKNYGISQLVRQANNFAVTPEFFVTDTDAPTGRMSPITMLPSLVGRYSARKPQSSIGDVIHGSPCQKGINANSSGF